MCEYKRIVHNNDAIEHKVTSASGLLPPLILLGGVTLSLTAAQVYLGWSGTLLPVSTAASWALTLILLLLHLNTVREESVLIIRGLGVQIASTTAHSTKRSFFSRDTIQSVFINEGYIHFNIVFYLALRLYHEQTLTMIFPSFRPTLETLQSVYVDLAAHVSATPK